MEAVFLHERTGKSLLPARIGEAAEKGGVRAERPARREREHSCEAIVLARFRGPSSGCAWEAGPKEIGQRRSSEEPAP